MDTSVQNARSWVDLLREPLQQGSDISEARIAAALLLDPTGKGTRWFERMSGLSRATVMATLETSSELVRLTDPGSNNFHHPEPLTALVQHRQFPAQLASESSFLSSADQENGVVSVHTTESVYNRAREEWVRLLDPHRDLWSNAPQQRSVGSRRAGSAGWALAVAYGDLTDTEISYEQARTVLGLSVRGTRAAVARLVKARWASVSRRSRQTVVTLHFGLLVDEEWSGVWRAGRRATRALQRHEREKARVAHRRTPLGLIAWLTARTRPEQPEDADPAWKALVATGTEEQIYAHLVAAEKAAKAPPKVPPPVVMDDLHVKIFMPELLVTDASYGNLIFNKPTLKEPS